MKKIHTPPIAQAPVVQKLDSAIQRINLYPVDSAIGMVSLIFIYWIVIYPVDSAIQLLNNWGQDITLIAGDLGETV